MHAVLYHSVCWYGGHWTVRVDEYVHGWRWTQHRNASSIHCQNYGRVSWYWLLKSFCYSVYCHTVFSAFIWNQNIAVWTVMKVRFRIKKKNEWGRTYQGKIKRHYITDKCSLGTGWYYSATINKYKYFYIILYFRLGSIPLEKNIHCSDIHVLLPYIILMYTDFMLI